MGVKHSVSYQSGENMAKKNDEELYDAAIAMIGSVTKLPAIRVDRDAFLRHNSPIPNILTRFWNMARSTCIRWSPCGEKQTR